jgi:hypothetical protein
VLIAVVNHSTLVSATDAQAAVDACYRQLRYHAAPAWGRHAVPVVLYPDESMAPAGSHLVVLLDDADTAGALGYHSETPQGLPYGRVFVKTSRDDNVAWSTVLSHEVLELFIDPNCQLWADRGDGHEAWAVEVGDPVQGQSYTPRGLTVAVSNFVFPEFFDPQAPAGSRLDQLSELTQPFTLAPGGYAIRLRDGATDQVFGAEHPGFAADKLHPASRTQRRLNRTVA